MSRSDPCLHLRDPGIRTDSQRRGVVDPRGRAGTLVFVDDRQRAPEPQPGQRVVVLDTAWTPAPDERPDIIPVRPIVARIVATHNLFDDSLALLDGWAAPAGVAARFTVRGVGWWSHARSFVRLVVHEVLVWRLILDELEATGGPISHVVVPGARRWLAAAARADPAVHVRWRRRRQRSPLLVRRARRIGTRLARRGRRMLHLGRVWTHVMRRRALEARVASLAAAPRLVLAPMRAASFHTIRGPRGQRRGDPYAEPVIEELALRGLPALRVVMGVSYRSDDDWARMDRDEWAIPWDYAERRWGGRVRPGEDAAAIRARLEGIPELELLVGRVDIGPVIRRSVVRQARWLATQAAAMDVVERLIDELRIVVMVTGWEAARTAWLGAAHRQRVPIVAIQHGVIYPNTPDYVRPPDPSLVLADLTCVYGPYERDLLVNEGGYPERAVVATGSPRATPASALRPLNVDERDAVRRRLGVRDGDRLLVVSTARRNVGDGFHSMAMAARLLAGPMPGVHIAFKLHPEEPDGSHYPALITGLAAAGGCEPPPMTVVREIDIYRLLRAADAHLGQYSTVLTDAVLTSTPNMVAVGQAWADVVGYADAGVATPVTTADDVRAFMADPRPPTADARARFLAAHFVDGDATGRIADHVEAVISSGVSVTERAVPVGGAGAALATTGTTVAQR